MTEGLGIRPIGICGRGDAGAEARPLAGGPLVYSACETILRDGLGGTARREVMTLGALGRWAETHGLLSETAALLERLSAPRAAVAGLGLDQPRIMGIVNVTPDSFSDGGDRFDPGRAVADGLAMLDAGADIIDVGGESTRPGAAAVAVEAEQERVLPVVRQLAAAGARVSIDTRRAAVMRAALAEGATVINDVTALSGEDDSLAVAAASRAAVVLMHMQGEPGTMQRDPRYDDVALDVYDYLQTRVAACEAAGLPRRKILVDPGIGFGKTVAHNLALIDQLALFHGLGCGLVLGASRKAFIGRLSRGEAPKERLPGSLAVALAAAARGAQVLRVHDVAETRQALDVWRAVGGPTEVS